MIIIIIYFKLFVCKHDYHWIEIVAWNHISVYEY